MAVRPSGHRDREVVGGLVLRRVVDGIPARRALRLVDDEGAVVGRDPAVLRLVRVDDRVRVAVVLDSDLERAAPADAGGRRDHELLAVPLERGGIAVDRHLADVETAQVEVKARQILRRPRGDHGARVERVVLGRVVEPQRVVADLIAAVARERKERVSGASRARGESGGRSGRSGDGKKDGDGYGGESVLHRADSTHCGHRWSAIAGPTTLGSLAQSGQALGADASACLSSRAGVSGCRAEPLPLPASRQSTAEL